MLTSPLAARSSRYFAEVFRSIPSSRPIVWIGIAWGAWVVCRFFCNFFGPCLPGISFLVHRQIPCAGLPLLIDIHEDRPREPTKCGLTGKCSDDLCSPFQFLVEAFHAIGRSDPFLMCLRKCRVVQKPGERPFNCVRCFSVSSYGEVIRRLLQSLLMSILLPQQASDLPLILLRNVPQDRRPESGGSDPSARMPSEMQ